MAEEDQDPVIGDPLNTGSVLRGKRTNAGSASLFGIAWPDGSVPAAPAFFQADRLLLLNRAVMRILPRKKQEVAP